MLDSPHVGVSFAGNSPVIAAVEHRLGDVTLLQEFCDTPDDLRQRFAPRSIALPPGVEIIA